MKTGDKVYLTGGFNNAGIKEDEIQSIGRKYFTLKNESRYKFNIETGLQEVDSNYRIKVWFDKNELDLYFELMELNTTIRQFFNGYGKINLPIEKLRQIAEIIK